jgi:hypothetical protein
MKPVLCLLLYNFFAWLLHGKVEHSCAFGAPDTRRSAAQQITGEPVGFVWTEYFPQMNYLNPGLAAELEQLDGVLLKVRKIGC